MFAVAPRHEQIAPALRFEQRLMQVPTTRIIAFERRPAHERGEIPNPATDLPRRRAEQQRMVGGLQRWPRGKGAFELARSPLVLDRAQWQSDWLGMMRRPGGHRLHQLQVGSAM